MTENTTVTTKGLKSTLVLAAGVVFVLIAILGFFMNPILGLFEVTSDYQLHNLVHLVSGIFALAYGIRSEITATLYGKIMAVVYALITILGVALNGNIFGLMQFNVADHILHLVLTIAFVVIGFFL